MRHTTAKPARGEVAFITQSFRDVADDDYIAARMLYRVGLDLQFLWAGLQAIEKYLKGILLYNGGQTRDLRHHLTKAYERAKEIPDLSFDLPDDLHRFLAHLETYGPDRYLEHPFVTDGDELQLLDRAVWHIRRFCQYLREPLTKDDTVVNARKIKQLLSPALLQRPTRFRIVGGRLERVLEQQGSPQRAALVWYNGYVGGARQRTIRAFPMRSVLINPIHFMTPGLFQVLQTRVFFSKPVVQYFQRP